VSTGIVTTIRGHIEVGLECPDRKTLPVLIDGEKLSAAEFTVGLS